MFSIFLGKKAALYEKGSPDWVPTVSMGQPKVSTTPSPLVASGRFQRRKALNEKSEAARTLISISETFDLDAEVEPMETVESELELETGTSTQTDITSVVFDSILNEITHLQAKNDEMTAQLKNQEPYSQHFFQENDEKVKYFTGLGCFTILMTLYTFLESVLPGKTSLSKFQCFILTLMKLRLNLSNVFLAYHFNVSPSTVSRIFNDYIDVMFVWMKPLIHWPEREILRKTMPMQFRKHFGRKCAVIIDCFEVFIETPSSVKTKCETWSSYKHHNTVKFLIGITPQGVISFISKFMGRSYK